MSIYYIVVFCVVLFCTWAQKYDYKIIDTTSTEKIKHTSSTKMFFVFAVIVLIFVAGFRYHVGADYGAYYRGCENYSNSFFKHLISLNEPGIRLIAKIVTIFKGNGFVFIFLCSLITIVLCARVIYKNTNMLLPATLLYVFLGCWHGSFNGVRQYMAAAIVFSGLRFIKEQKFWKYALVVFIAFLFHSSAIVMIFAYFIAYNKISLRNIALLIGASLIILFSFTEVLEFTGFLLQEDLTDEGAYLTRSVNTLRILVAIAPAIFFLLVYQNKTITKEQRFWFNMLILNGIVMFATSNSAYLARMGIYTAPFSAIGIPELMKGSNIKQKKTVTAIILISFAMFWLYEIQKSSSLNDFTFIWQK